MSELLLNSLRIENYRSFKNLAIEKLGRVNLIVGKNNVGKTALLEGLWLYANAGYESLMFEILRERDEIPPFQDGAILVQPESSRGLRNMFYGRPDLSFMPTDTPEDLNGGLRFRIGEDIDISGPDPKLMTNTLWAIAHRSGSNDPSSVPSVQNELKPYRRIPNAFVKANGLTDKKLIEFWDNIEKLVREDLVIEALSIVTPELRDIRFSGYPNGSFSRVPVVRLEGAKERVPLRSLGEGMTKVLGIASALINCESGMLLIDEIEGGLHYTVMLQLWKLIFKTAKDLNAQIFATTHSEDCVEAFTAAAEESPEDGILIRLERQGEQIVAKTIEEKRLEIAMKHGVEVR